MEKKGKLISALAHIGILAIYAAILYFVLYPRFEELCITMFNCFSILAGILIIASLLVRIVNRHWLRSPLIMSAIFLAASRLGPWFYLRWRSNVDYMLEQLRVGGSDFQFAPLRLGMPFALKFFVCFILSLLSVFSVLDYFLDLKMQRRNAE